MTLGMGRRISPSSSHIPVCFTFSICSASLHSSPPPAFTPWFKPPSSSFPWALDYCRVFSSISCCDPHLCAVLWFLWGNFKQHVKKGLSDLPLKQVIKPSCAWYPHSTQGKECPYLSKDEGTRRGIWMKRACYLFPWFTALTSYPLSHLTFPRLHQTLTLHQTWYKHAQVQPCFWLFISLWSLPGGVKFTSNEFACFSLDLEIQPRT